jgi:hypothetical protein
METECAQFTAQQADKQFISGPYMPVLPEFYLSGIIPDIQESAPEAKFSLLLI